MVEIVRLILDFVRELHFIDVLSICVKFVVLCFVITFLCEGIDALIWVIKLFTIGSFNWQTTKFQKKVEERCVINYQKTPVSSVNIINISDLVEATPKLVADINILTGRVRTKEVWKKRGIFEKFIHPLHYGMARTITAEAETENVRKSFIYVQSLVNTLNFHYPNWQDLNPELIGVLKSEKIVAEEVVIPYLQNFRH